MHWTLHDCWAFTGHCSHFDFVGCEKWKTGCHHCPQKKNYPKSLFLDQSKRNWEEKKRLFTSISNMTIVTPSHWLAGLVNESFLSKYPVKVIHNGIDLEVFKPTQTTWKRDHGITKPVVLACSFDWNERKGYNDVLKLAELLPEYQFVVVGISEKQVKTLPRYIIGIQRTDSVQELVKIYSIADVFINTTYEDNYPTVNLEAIACGTPVITYDTGGSQETIKDSFLGSTVPKGDISSMLEMIQKNINEHIKRDNQFVDSSLNNISPYRNYHKLFTLIVSFPTFGLVERKIIPKG